MKYLFWIIIALYLLLAVSLLTKHFGVAQNIAKYLFGIQVSLLLIYLIDLKFK